MRRRSVWVVGGVAVLAVVAVAYAMRKQQGPTAAAPKPAPVKSNDTVTGSVDAFLRAGGSPSQVI